MLIDEAVIGGVLGTALRSGGDFAEIFAEDRRATGARLDDGRVEDLASGRERGAGIRVVVGDTTGFAHTSDLSEAGLRAAAEAAAGAARKGGGGVQAVALTRVDAKAPTSVAVLPETVAKADKVALCEQAAYEALQPQLGPGQTSVGMRVEITHLVPVLVGSRVTASAAYERAEGKRIFFNVTVTDRCGLVAAGRVVRVVLDRDAFLEKAR